jgi:hypothetical protein
MIGQRYKHNKNKAFDQAHKMGEKTKNTSFAGASGLLLQIKKMTGGTRCLEQIDEAISKLGFNAAGFDNS